jgi:hypothetical protein
VGLLLLFTDGNVNVRIHVPPAGIDILGAADDAEPGRSVSQLSGHDMCLEKVVIGGIF